MNKKIIFLILFLLSVIINVKAIDNVLEIDDTNYVLNKDINEKYYSYTISNNTLVLNGYKGSHIRKDGTLNVIVNGDNYLSDNNGLVLIKANDLTISGDGMLNFDATASAITADNVSINDVTIKGTTTRELIYSTNELNINNVEIDFEAKGILIFGGNTINVNNSIIKSINRWGFRYTNNGLATINNSDINMECSVTCISATAKMHFNNTNAYFYGKTSASGNMELSFKQTGFMISEDGVNYREIVDYNGYPYLKTTAIVDLGNENNDLNQDDGSDIDKDTEIEEGESSIGNGDNNNFSNNENNKALKEDNNFSDKETEETENKGDSFGNNNNDSKQDTGLNDNASNDDLKEDDLNDKNGNLNDNNFDNIDNKDDLEDNDNLKADNNSSDLQKGENLDNKESIDDDKLDQDDSSDNNLEDGNSNLNDKSEEGNNTENVDKGYTENEYGKKDEFYTEGEYDEDYSNEVENPKTYDAVGNSILWLIISLTGITFLVIILKRNISGKV